MARTITAAGAGWTYDGTAALSVKSCPVCGITYGIPSALDDAAREYNRSDWPNNTLSWHCPNGHSLSYPGESEETKLKRRLKQAQDRAGWNAARADQAEASAKAHRGAATRARNERDKAKARIAKGVCPCCNRNFKNVQRHMATQHPDYHLPGDET
jgi:hypothetical protein